MNLVKFQGLPGVILSFKLPCEMECFNLRGNYYTTNGILIKILVIFFIEVRKYSIFTWSHKRPQIAKTILRKKSNEGTITPEFQLYFRALATKNSMVLAKTKT